MFSFSCLFNILFVLPSSLSVCLNYVFIFHPELNFLSRHTSLIKHHPRASLQVNSFTSFPPFLSVLFIPSPLPPSLFQFSSLLYSLSASLDLLRHANPNLRVSLDSLFRPVVPWKDSGSVPALGGAGETPQEAAGQVWQRAAALFWSHVLRAQRFTAGARSHQVGVFKY